MCKYLGLQRIAKRAHGQAMVEFALVIPVMLLLVFGVVEFGRAYYTYSALTNAARKGARYGSLHPTDTAGIQNRAIQTATGVSLTAGEITVVCSPSCAGGNPLRVQIAHPFRPVVASVGPSFTLRTAITIYIE